MQLSRRRQASLAEDGLDLGIQGLSLRCLPINCTEAFDVHLFACLLHCIAPLLQSALRKVLLGSCGCSLTHNLPTLALDKGSFCQAAHRLLLLALEDCSLSTLALGDDADFLHLLQALHGLLNCCLHGLHGG